MSTMSARRGHECCQQTPLSCPTLRNVLVSSTYKPKLKKTSYTKSVLKLSAYEGTRILHRWETQRMTISPSAGSAGRCALSLFHLAYCTCYCMLVAQENSLVKKSIFSSWPLHPLQTAIAAATCTHFRPKQWES